MANINEIADYLMRPPPKPYDQVNPFDKFFDEQAARQKAKKEFDPYYREQYKLAKRDRSRYMNRSKVDVKRQYKDIATRGRFNQQDYDTAAANINIGRTRTEQDYNTTLADLTTSRARTTQDRDTSLGRLGENRNVSRNLEDMNYNPLVENAMNNLALSGRTWGGRRGEVMGQLGRERDMRIGGINTEYNRGVTDTNTAYGRAMQDFDTQQTAAGTDYNRSMQNFGIQQAAAGTARNRANYGLKNERIDTKIGYRRGKQDYNTAYQRDTLARQRERRTALRGETERQRGIKSAEWDRAAQRYYQSY